MDLHGGTGFPAYNAQHGGVCKLACGLVSIPLGFSGNRQFRFNASLIIIGIYGGQESVFG